jgi:L-tartrate/succinate antiporter
MLNQPSARKIGGYIMWVTFAAGCVTSTLFMTACAPNFLALEFIREIAGVEITYLQWMLASAPFALPLLLLPILTYVFIRRKPEVATKFPPGRPKSCRRWGHFRVESAFFLLWFCLP